MAETRFAFGKNWKEFVKRNLNNSRIEEAKKSLINFTNNSEFKGKIFLDIGCGSGLFSLAAYRLGATVYSFDIDKDSVECTKQLRKAENASSEKWIINEGSILDETFMKKLPKADIVYSWGVLHHTGQMWKSIENASEKVKKGGLLYIAIYNRSNDRFINSKRWRLIKYVYNRSNIIVKKMIILFQIIRLFLIYVGQRKNPFKEIKNYKSFRGMNWYTDVVDWVGGYPYQFASVGELFNFFKKRNMQLINLNENTGYGCHELLLRKLK